MLPTKNTQRFPSIIHLTWPVDAAVRPAQAVPTAEHPTISLQESGLRALVKTARAASICDIFLSAVLVAAGFFAVVAWAAFGAGCFLAVGFFAEAFLAGAVLVAVVVFFVAMFVFPLVGVSRFRVGHRGQRDHAVTSVSITHPALSGHNSRNFFTPETDAKNASQPLIETAAKRARFGDTVGVLAGLAEGSLV